MMNPTCPICGGPTLMSDESGKAMVCKCMQVHTTFTTVDGMTFSTEGFNKFLRNMRDWNVTLHGNFAREPVPDAFQDAFQDGELEL